MDANQLKMTESDRKLLTSYLGECWHQRLEPYHASGVCRKCNTYFEDWDDVEQRTFTNIQDFYDLKCKMVERGSGRRSWHTHQERILSKGTIQKQIAFVITVMNTYHGSSTPTAAKRLRSG